jgi:hypothetical protein
MTEYTERCLRCDNTKTYKKCSRCGETFLMSKEYRSCRLPTMPFDKTRFVIYDMRFKYYDLCDGCMAEMGGMLREFLHE